ncbi:hypothetical protein BD779DRAFT_1518282 [Infundibulicybe gibba]|nr:hypothetical protein BD779DRAFT_1518282 [Infundibulicybe gibba]
MRFQACLILPFLYQVLALYQDQVLMQMDDLQKPAYEPLTHSKPTLADLLTIDSSASIFYSYARELELSRILSDVDANITVLVPTNKAVMALARKPHQGTSAVEDKIEISEIEFDRRSKQNVQRWVSAHIIPQSPISLAGHTYNTLLDDRTITFTPITKSAGKGSEWSQVTLEDGIHITSKKEGLNGVLYMIDGTISPDNTL